MKYLIVPFLVLAFSPFAFARQPASCAEWRQADFAANAYRQAAVNAEAYGNFVLSPWSVASLFGALQTGARGDTACEMARTLQLGGEETLAPDAVAETFRAARACLASVANADVALELSDSLWLAHGFSVEPEFSDRLRDAFDASVHSIEMGPVGRKIINDFVSEKTHGRIEDLIAPGVLKNRETLLVAVDTVYFKAKWQDPFKKRAVLRLPYRSSETEMLVVLPSPSNTLADIEAKISGVWLERLAERPWRGMAEIALPKFDFDSEHDLKSMLVSMGMAAPFEPLSANFSGIAPGHLVISTAIQKANVTVDEEGTEAAAASYVTMSRGRPHDDPAPQRSFVADRPFLFLIRETSTGLIRVMKPVPPRKDAGSREAAVKEQVAAERKESEEVSETALPATEANDVEGPKDQAISPSTMKNVVIVAVSAIVLGFFGVMFLVVAGVSCFLKMTDKWHKLGGSNLGAVLQWFYARIKTFACIGLSLLALWLLLAGVAAMLCVHHMGARVLFLVFIPFVGLAMCLAGVLMYLSAVAKALQGDNMVGQVNEYVFKRGISEFLKLLADRSGMSAFVGIGLALAGALLLIGFLIVI